MTETAVNDATDLTDLDLRAVDTLRVLAADAVEKVGSGHPGTAMALAPAAYLLFQRVMRHDPADPRWIGRDRFILSPGHSSLTLYLQLYLCGYGMELEDIQALRTWDSQTPGHPEFGHTDGVEITTGPLGQGLASAVGFAYGQRRMRGLLDPEAESGASPFDHAVWVIASDGDLQEGVTSEASSLAGHQELGNLNVIWDDNRISIEDDTDIAFTEDVMARYTAYGWHVQRVDWLKTGDYVEDIAELQRALEQARAETSKPSLIALRTVIGWPAPTKQNTGGIHGAKLGEEELAGLKQALDFDPEKHFHIDDEVLTHTREVGVRGAQARAAWEQTYQQWRESNTDGAALLDRLLAGELPAGWDHTLPNFPAGDDLATRAASGKVLNALAPVLPELWGGSADLAGSNNTLLAADLSFAPQGRSTEKFDADRYGRNLHFGVREHAAAAITNGIQLSTPLRTYNGTFLIFSDYQRPAVRLAALMGVGSIFVWTHDSIGLGEDGPTHQPVEQLASLRAIPGLDVVRPADANEVAVAWREIIANADRPAGIALTRQKVPTFERGADAATAAEFGSAEGVARGAYILAEAVRDGVVVVPDVILIGTGSEVSLAVTAREQLAQKGIAARVVSAPCLEWFAQQEDDYRESVLPSTVRARAAVEAAHPMTWYPYVGDAGRIVGLDHFGASADYKVLYEQFGITAEAVAAAAEDSIRAAA